METLPGPGFCFTVRLFCAGQGKIRHYEFAGNCNYAKDIN